MNGSRWRTRSVRLALVVVTGFVVALAPSVAGAMPAVADADLVVDGTGDTGDATPGDGTCLATGGGCTLTAALQEAAATPGLGVVDVTVPAGTYPLVGPIVLDRDVTVTGAGRTTTTVDLDGGVGFAVDTARLELTALTVANGQRSGEGGSAIAAIDSDVVLDDVGLDSNQATGDGGAVRVVGGSVRFDGVHATDSSGQLGGTLYAALADVDVLDSVFLRSGASTSGGSVYASFPLSLTIDGSTFTDGGVLTQGGAVALAGYGGTSSTPLKISDSTFTDNIAGRDGGALYVRRLASDDHEVALAISHSHFDGNSAQVGGAIGIDLAEVIVTDSTFTDNKAAEGSGGAIASGGAIEIHDSTFTGNSATESGGAVAANGPAEITGSTFTGNSAGIFGGALDLFGDETPVVTDNEFTDNHAVTGGGAIHRLGDDLDEDGNDFEGNTPEGSDVLVAGPTVAAAGDDGSTDGSDGTDGSTDGGSSDGSDQSSDGASDGADTDPEEAAGSGGGSLPITGFAVGGLLLLAGGLVVGGTALRRGGRRSAS